MIAVSSQTNLPWPCEPLRSLSEAADVMLRSWKQNTEQPLLYTPKFLQSCLDYPGDLPSLCPAIYLDGQLAAFVFGLPRRASYAGRELNLLLFTFLTVAPEFKGRGLGVEVWAECIRQGRSAGYDGVIHYCVQGNPSNKVTVAGARAAGYEAVRVFEISYLMRLLRRPTENEQDHPQSCDLGNFLDAAEITASRAPLARRWTIAEARWQCDLRAGAVCLQGEGRAIISGYNMQVADDQRTTCTFVEDILWESTPNEARLALLNRFVDKCSHAAQVIVVPLLGYASAEPFLSAGFRRSPRKLNAYLTLWGPSMATPLQAMYMDVL